MSSEITYTAVRTVFMPGINDFELESIAEIAKYAEELSEITAFSRTGKVCSLINNCGY